MDNLIKNRIIIIAGGFGSGKTNIAVNLAEFIAQSGKNVSVTDLDIVNPYFRSADNVKELTALGIRAFVPEFANTNVEIPSLPKEYCSIFSSDDIAVVDVGGDPEGAIVLSVDAEKYEKSGYSMYYVYNCYRPMTSSPEQALALLRHIEHTSRLSFSGVINNSNLGTETTAELVRASFPKAKRLSELSDLPLLATTAINILGLDGVTPIKNKTRVLF